MTVAVSALGPGGQPEDIRVASRQARALPPERDPGLHFLGSEAACGHRRPPSLVRRGDGQTLQLTPLLHDVLELVDGRTTIGEIADAVSARAGKIATADDINFLLEQRLRPLGLLKAPDGTAPSTTKANPLLALRCRMVVSNPDITDAIASKFAPLFRPACVAFVMAAFVAATGWVFFDMGLAHPARQALYDPGLLLAVFVLTAASAAFHEVGHASACRYGGARPGVMGAGLYLLWPAFYTDVSDAYRLNRVGRLRVDLGGIYFNAVFALAAVALYCASGSEALLIVVPLQLLQMVRHLAPFVRLDGYHILADVTGVPDLFAHIRPVLVGLLPWRWGRPEAKRLKPWARIVVSTWVLVVMPLLAYTFVMLVMVFPRLAATTWDSLGFRLVELRVAYSKGDVYTAVVDLLGMVALALPVFSISYILVRTVRRIVRTVWRTTAGHPTRRALSVIAGAVIVALLVSSWLPGSQRRPIAGNERGILSVPGPTSLLPISADRGSETPSPVPNVGGSGDVRSYQAASFHTNGTTHIALAVIPRPQQPAEAVDPPAADPAWHSPLGNVRFNPPTPGPGDNFAVVVNTQDGSFLVSSNFSLVFADGDSVTNRNRAYALANCQSCSTIAVAFQVVLIVSDANTITPDNMAVAINAACAICDTRALAMQLIATTGPLSDHTVNSLLDAWKPLANVQQLIATSSIAEIQTQLFQVESQILGILTRDNALVMPATGSQQSAGVATTATETPTTTTSPPAATTTDASSTTHAPTTATTATTDTPETTTTTTPGTTTTTPETTTSTAPQPTEPSTTTTTEPPATTSG